MDNEVEVPKVKTVRTWEFMVLIGVSLVVALLIVVGLVRLNEYNACKRADMIAGEGFCAEYPSKIEYPGKIR